MDIKGKKIGLVGDLHLGSKNGNDSERWEKVYDEVLDWIIESFLGKVDTIFFLGDIFDGKFSKTSEKAMSFRTLDYADKFFGKLAEDFEVVAFSGNHDVYYKERCDVSALALLKNKPNIHIITEPTGFTVRDKVYKIFPWSCDIFFSYQDGDRYDGIFAHLDIQNFKLNAFKVSEHGYSAKELFKITDKVYTGHYHHRQQRSYNKDKNEIFYLGSPLQINWSEAGKESYIYILDLIDNEVCEEFLNDFSPKHIKVKASEILEEPKQGANNILEILWDVERNDKIINRLVTSLDKHKVFSHKSNFELVGGEKVELSKLEEVSAAIEPTEQIEEYVEEQEWVLKQETLEKCKELYLLVK